MKISYRMFVSMAVLILCLMMIGCTPNKTVDNSNKEQPEVTETKEERIYSIFKEMNVEEKMNEILPLIANIDWHTYDGESGERTMALIDFLQQNQNYIDSADFPNLILATKGLDGAWSESFSSIVGGLFIRDRDGFIKALAESPDVEQRESVIRYIAYNLNYQDVKPIIAELEQLRISEEYSDPEKEVIASLLVDLKNPY